MDIIRVENIVKQYDQEVILKNVTLSFEKGTVTSIIGQSGSGKSTLLRCLNQLEEVTSGSIYFKEYDLTLRSTNLNQIRSKIGMVFQSFNLFEHMSVIKNVTIGQTKVLKKTKEEAYDNAIKYLDKVGLKDFQNRKVSSLSGGQKQRVAIARTLAMDPEVILFDEPTSALDPLMVKEVLDVIRTIAQSDLTVIVVTHEMAFAKEISDRVIYMENGLIVVDDTVDEVFNNQTHQTLQNFLSKIN